jgi:hypothetical protein
MTLRRVAGPLRNMAARLKTALDIDLAATFDVTDFLFPVRD